MYHYRETKTGKIISYAAVISAAIAIVSFIYTLFSATVDIYNYFVFKNNPILKQEYIFTTDTVILMIITAIFVFIFLILISLITFETKK